MITCLIRLFNNTFALLGVAEYSPYARIDVSALFLPDPSDIDQDFELN